MATTLLKAAPLFLLMAFPGVSSPAGVDEPGDDKVIVSGDRFVTIDDDDKPMVFEFGNRRGGYLGIQLLEMTPALREHFGAPKDAGVLVGDVEANSPAAKAGVQVGDVVTRVDGDRVEHSGDLRRLIRRKKSGETVKIEVQRNKNSKTLSATIEERKGQEIELGDLRRRIREESRDWGRDMRDWGREMRDFHVEIPRIGRLDGLDKLQDKLDRLEKRLSDLEKRLK